MFCADLPPVHGLRRTAILAPLLFGIVTLLGCSGEAEDVVTEPGEVGSDEQHIRAKLYLAAGGSYQLDAKSSVEHEGVQKDCQGTDVKEYGARVAWDAEAQIAAGTFYLSPDPTFFPQITLSYPMQNGKPRRLLLSQGTVVVLSFGQGVIHGVFEDIHITPNDDDDTVIQVEQGSFRCMGAIP